MKFLKKFALATALAATFGTAYADDSVLNAVDSFYNNLSVGGNINVNGNLYVTEEGSASTNNMQSVLTNAAEYSLTGGHNHATIGNSLQNIEGNIGANVSAGYSNAQSNQTSLAVSTSDGALSNAQTFNQQSVGSTTLAYTLGGSSNGATLGQYALGNARGNVGVNLVSGVGNAQSNALAVSAANDSVITKAANSNEQIAVGNHAAILPNSKGGPNTSSIHSGALIGAQGNIGVNVTTGAGNLQSNALSIAIAQ